jgi:hypothetical protein
MKHFGDVRVQRRIARQVIQDFRFVAYPLHGRLGKWKLEVP